MRCEWDPEKAKKNLQKHGVDFADAVIVLEDPFGLTVSDVEYGEQRFVTLGLDAGGPPPCRRLHRGRRQAPHHLRTRGQRERTETVREKTMKDEYDFSQGERGPVIALPTGKTRITIRLDNDVLGWFKDQVHRAGGGNYQTLINQALRAFIHGQSEPLEDTLRRVVSEELDKRLEHR